MTESELVDPPKWVTKEFIQNCLRLGMNDLDLHISEIHIKGGSYKGDNYSSIVSRAKILYHTKGKIIKRGFIIKTMPVWEEAVKFVTRMQSFKREIFMLTEAVPSMERILEDVGLTLKLAPKVHYSSLHPEPIIIMDDLSELGFKTSDRFIGLNFRQCAQAMKLIASFHAASIVYLKKRPEIKKIIEKCHWGIENQESTREFLYNTLETVIDKVDTWSEGKWSEKIKPLLNKHPQKMYDIYDCRDPCDLIVLNHADFWLGNILFSEDSSEARFIDFQISTYQSPTIDLLYFIFTSPMKQVRFRDMDTLFQLYHLTFLETCDKLNLNISYSFSQLMGNFRKRLFFGFSIFCSLLPLFSAHREDAADQGKKESDVFKNKYFQECFLDGLPFFEKHGLFDIHP